MYVVCILSWDQENYPSNFMLSHFAPQKLFLYYSLEEGGSNKPAINVNLVSTYSSLKAATFIEVKFTPNNLNPLPRKPRNPELR